MSNIIIDDILEKAENINKLARVVCDGCPHLVYPWVGKVDRHNHLLPMDEWQPTCSMNDQRGYLEGMYGKANPCLCEKRTKRYKY